ncbi:MAG: DPP IV N-terminal domain-containing protein [Bacteroidota bacterium]
MKHTRLFISLLFVVGFTTAQNKTFTMEEAVLKGRTVLSPKRLNQLNWIKNSNSYYYYNDAGTEIYRGSFLAAQDDKLLVLEDFNGQLEPVAGEKVDKIPAITWKSDFVFSFMLKEKKYDYNVSTKRLVLAKDAIIPSFENEDKAANGAIAYTEKNNLFIYKDSKSIQVTFDGTENNDIVNGQAVHQQEFGIYKGTFWSNDGNQLAFYRMDQSMVTDYPVIDWSVKPAKNQNKKYPFAGNASHHVTLGVYDVTTGKTVFIKTGEPKEQYLTNIAWSPNGTRIYIAVLNRDQNHLKLNQYNAQTGEFVKTLFEEKDEKFVQPLNAMLFIKNNASQFIWQSNRDGFNHLYLYDAEGQMLKQLTKGNWEVTAVNGFDELGSNLFFHSNIGNPTEQQFCMVDVKSGKMKQLTKTKGVHNCLLNDKATDFIDNFSNITTPRLIDVYDVKSAKSKNLLTAENPVKEYKLGQLNLFTVKADDGTDLWCRMFKPADFDSTKKYPAIVYVYGGPGVQLITNSWLGGADLWYHYMAQRGYIVFTVDNRGTKGRGKTFEQATFRQLGTVEISDQMKGVDYLKSQKYVDAKRLGVDGWSFGGFMTTSMMTRTPDVFKVGVAGGPVIDWSYYEIMYTERYMDTPQTNKEGFEKSNLLNYVGDLKGKLMLIHGASDDVVVWQHSMMYLKKAVDKGVHLDYFVYPGHYHNVVGKDRVHLMQKIADYFITNL